MSGIRQDVAFALRQMRRSPGFAVTAVLTLALGIAANVIVFGVLQALVLQPVDVPHGDRVMTLQLSTSAFPFIAYPEVRDVRDGNTVFSAVAAYSMQNFGLEANGVTRPVWGYEVSGQYFEVAAIKPFLGRLLERADDDHPGASEAAVLSWPAWKSHFEADPNIVGKTVRINKHPYTIVGVTPEGFNGTEKLFQPDIFVPMANEASLEGVNWLEQRRAKHVFSAVRIKDGVTLPQAQAELDAIAARIRRQYPAEEEGLGFKLARPGLIGDTLGGAGARFSDWGDGAGRYCAARRLRQPRQPVRGAHGRPHPRDCHPPGHRVQPLAHSPPGAGRGVCDFDSRGRMRLRPGVDRSHRPG